MCFWKELLDNIFAVTNYLQKLDINVNTTANLINATQRDLVSLTNDDTFSHFKVEL